MSKDSIRLSYAPWTFVAGLLFGAHPLLATDLTGEWAYHPEKSAEVRPTNKRPSIFAKIKPSVSIGGLPVPLPGDDSDGEASEASARDPDVLYCRDMSIKEIDGAVMVTYGALSSAEFVPGKHLGRVTRWTGKKLSQTYTTTSRKVSQTYELHRNGDMLVTVKINPNQGRTRVYKRIFERVN